MWNLGLQVSIFFMRVNRKMQCGFMENLNDRFMVNLRRTMRSNGYFLSFIYLDYSRDGNLGVLRKNRDSSPRKNWIKHTAQIAIYWDMQNEGNCVLYLYESQKKSRNGMARRHPFGRAPWYPWIISRIAGITSVNGL